MKNTKMLDYAVSSFDTSFTHFKKSFDEYATQLDDKIIKQENEINRLRNAFVQTELVIHVADSSKRTNYESMRETIIFNLPIEISMSALDEGESCIMIEIPSSHHNLSILQQATGNFDGEKREYLINKIYQTLLKLRRLGKEIKEVKRKGYGVCFNLNSEYAPEIKTRVGFNDVGKISLVHYLQEEIDEEFKALYIKDKNNYQALLKTRQGIDTYGCIGGEERFSIPILGIENAKVIYTDDDEEKHTGTVFLPFRHFLPSYNDKCIIRLDGTGFWEGEEYVDVSLEDLTFIDPSVKPILQPIK